jgi:hypothetical protein
MVDASGIGYAARQIGETAAHKSSIGAAGAEIKSGEC